MPSPFDTDVAPITATDDELRQVLAEAELPPLLPAIAYATGDLSVLRDDLRPDPLLVAAMPQGGLDDSQQEQIRQLAFDALVRFRDQGSAAAAAPERRGPAAHPPLHGRRGRRDGALPAAAGGGAGLPGRGPAGTGVAQAGARTRDATSPSSSSAPACPGLLVAHRLQQAGIAFTVVEKDDDVGGTWLENTYPGCRVDNPNHNYSYSFAQRHDWPLHFSTQDVLLDYFRHCADAFELRPHIRFGTEVISATWSDADERWTVRTRTADGAETELTANAVVSAVGQLNRPSFPDIDGVGSFAGPDVPLGAVGPRRRPRRQAGRGDRHRRQRPAVHPRDRRRGRRAASSSSAPRRGWRRRPSTTSPSSPAYSGSTATCPAYSELNRFSIFWRMGDGALEAVRVDPGWEGLRPDAVSEANDMGRMMLTAYLDERVRRPPRPARPGHARLPDRRQADAARQRRLGPHAQARERAPRHRPDRGDHADRHPHGRRQRARARRPHLRHRLHTRRVPDADAGHGPRRRRPARAVGRRRPRLPRDHRPRLPQPVLPLRPEHEHRRQRQHRVLLGVRRPLHPRLPRAAAAGRPPRPRRAARTCTTPSTRRSTPRTAPWRGAGPT